MRTGIKELVTSAHSTKLQAHEKVATAVAQSVERSKSHQVIEATLLFNCCVYWLDFNCSEPFV